MSQYSKNVDVVAYLPLGSFCLWYSTESLLKCLHSCVKPRVNKVQRIWLRENKYFTDKFVC